MDNTNPHKALDATQGHLPSPEFVESLRLTLEQELAAQSDGTRTVTSDVSIVDTVLEPDMEQPMDSNKRLMAIVGAAAAIVVAIIGIIVVTNDDDPVGIDVVDQPDSTPTDEVDGEVAADDPGDASTAEDPLPPTTAAVEPTTTEPERSWEFEITYIEVPAGNSVAADAESAWVASDAGTLSRIDLSTNTVDDTYEIPTGANGTYFGFGTVWIGNRDGTVSRFDPASETITSTIELGGAPVWIEAGEDSMWAGNGGGSQALRIDPATDTVVATIDIGASAGAIKQNASGVWIRDFEGSVTRIDPETNTVLAEIETPDGALAMMAGPDAVWAPGNDSGLVYRIDPATNTITEEIDLAAAIGEPAQTFGIHYIGDTIWVRYIHDGTNGVARIDPETNEVVAFQDLRPGWTVGGMNVGPTTAWTFADDAVARMDFSIE